MKILIINQSILDQNFSNLKTSKNIPHFGKYLLFQLTTFDELYHTGIFERFPPPRLTLPTMNL